MVYWLNSDIYILHAYFPDSTFSLASGSEPAYLLQEYHILAIYYKQDNLRRSGLVEAACLDDVVSGSTTRV